MPWTAEELELLEVFRPEAEGYLARLRAGATPAEAAAILHNFKGAAGTVGLTALAQRAAAIEARAKAGEAPAEPDLAALEALLRGVDEAAPSEASATKPTTAATLSPPSPGPSPRPSLGAGATAPVPAASLPSLSTFLPSSTDPQGDDSAMMAELRGVFVVEAREHLEAMNAAMMRLEANRADRTPLQELLRKTHTIKGAAGAVGLAAVGTFAHRMEDALAAVNKGKLELDAQVFDRFLAANDILTAMVELVASGQTPELPARDDDPLHDIFFVGAVVTTAASDAPAPVLPFAPVSGSLPATPAAPAARLSGRVAAAMGLSLSGLGARPAVGPPPPARAPMPVPPAAGLETTGVLDGETGEHDDERAITTSDELSVTGTGDFTTSGGTGDFSEEGVPAADRRRRVDRRLEKEVVRVDLARVDALQGTLGDLVIGRNRDDLHVADLKALSSDLVSGRRRLVAQIELIRALHQGAREEPGRDPQEVLQVVADHERRLVEFDTRLNGSLAQLERLIAVMIEDGESRRRALNDMEQQISSVRMMSVRWLYTRLQRPIRDAARQMGKEAQLVTEGDDVELDKSVVDQISDPLVHLVRNAVAHGIEPADVRVRRGKPRVGTVRVSARRLGGSIIIEVGDDGGGIDPGRIRAAMVRAGLASSARAARLRDGELTEAIFWPGVSTRHTVDDVAGRGVGLDLVRANVEAVGGSIELKTKLGEGTTFIIRLPQTLMILPALMVQAGGQQFAVPMLAVRAVTRIGPDDVRAPSGETEERILFRRERIAVHRLERLLGLPAARAAVRPAVVLEGDAGPYALVVDALLGRQEIVVKNLGQLLSGLRAFAGATLTGTGRICLILDAATLHRHRAAAAALRPEERRTPLVLLVDDSTSIREAHKRIFAAAGYRVQTAADGLEAWDFLRAGDVDLVITDLEMPGMSGYDLLDRVRRSPRHRGLPVIVLSGLSSDDNKRIAREKGARDYLVKPVNRKVVLERAAEVLGHPSPA
ncbi:MAG TPA: Hpt domain-containing protein [Myxococcota bacterium]|nr:Hpt domain-containing protein [Myxococcota bacterium]